MKETEKNNKNEDKDILLSQNFLKDPELVEHLLEKTSIDSKNTVYEIGAGKGIITEKLLEKSSKVIAFEKDEELFLKLEEKFKNNENVEIHLGDFLKQDVDFENSKVFSNIPFNITADIIKKLVNVENSPIDTYLFVQKEAFEKYSGKYKEALVSLLIKPWFELREIHNFSPEDFSPKPSVDIVLLQIKKREEFLVERENNQLYKDFISYSLSQWQPNINKTFKNIFSYKQLKRLSKDLNFDLENKVTDLTFEQFLNLFNYFLQGVDYKKQKEVLGFEKDLQKQQKNLKKIHRSRTDKSWREKA